MAIEVHPDDEIWKVIKRLVRLTFDAEISWTMDGTNFHGPVTYELDGWMVILHEGGAIELIQTANPWTEYKWKSTPFGRDLYRAARNGAWEGPEPEEVASEFLDDLNSKINSNS